MTASSTTETATEGPLALRHVGSVALVVALVALAGVVASGALAGTAAGGGQGGTVGSDDDPGSASLEINETSRSVAQTELPPGGSTTVEVVVTTEDSLGSAELFEIEEAFSPGFEDVELLNMDPGGSGGSGPDNENLRAIWSTTNETYTLTYEVTVPPDAEQGDQFGISGTVSTGDREQSLPSDTITVNTDITGVELQPAEATAQPGDDVTFDVVVRGADAGIGSYSLDVSTDAVGVGEFTAVDLTENPDTDNSAISTDGTTATVAAEMGANAHEGADEIVIAELTFNTTAEGDAEFSIASDGTVSDSADSTYDLEFRDGASLTVADLDPPFYEVDELVSPDEVEVSSAFEVSATVSNTGELDGTKEVRLLVDGSVEATESLPLGAGESETVTFTDVSIDTTGEFEVGVETDDDSASASVSVSEDVGPPPISTEDPPQDLDGDGLFEDIDGNGEFDIFDVRAFFNNLDNPDVVENAEFFNFDGDDEAEIDIFDVRALFNLLQN